MSNRNVLIDDARIIFRNFAGKEGMYNREGDRNFSVILPPDLADQLAKDGWNVKWLKARDDTEPDAPYLQVSVSYKSRPPRVAMITSRGRTNLGEDELELLDWAYITKADLIINPYDWAVAEKHGIKAYLKSLFVTIEEDELEQRYADLDDVLRRT